MQEAVALGILYYLGMYGHNEVPHTCFINVATAIGIDRGSLGKYYSRSGFPAHLGATF